MVLRTSSNPANPKKPSFLDLPPEVRNQVYGMLYQHVDPLLINQTCVHPGLYRRMDDHNTGLAPARCNRIFRTFIKGGNDDFLPWTYDLIRAYQPNLNLLLTCQQVYVEAATTLYSNNSFEITGGVTRWHVHDGCFMRLGIRHWLRELGSQMLMLRNLTIDMNAVCRVDCPGWDRVVDDNFGDIDSQAPWVDFGPLIRTIWQFNLPLKVTVVQSTSAFHERCVSSANSHLHAAIHHAAALTSVVRALCSDELNLKKYWRVISLIGILRDGSGGVIIFDTTNDWAHGEVHRGLIGTSEHPKMVSFPDTAVHFIAEEARVLRLQKQRPPNFQNLPRHIRNRIEVELRHMDVDIRNILDIPNDH